MPPRKPTATGSDAAAAPKHARPSAAKSASARAKANAVAGVDVPPTLPAAVTVPAVPASSPRRAGGGLIAAGIGSAALVAALLFVTRGKRKDWSK